MAEKTKLGIDEKLNKLLKSVTDDYFEDEEVEDEDYISEDDLEKGTADDEEIVYDFDNEDSDLEDEDPDLEKSEDDDIEEDQTEDEPVDDIADEPEEEPEADEDAEEIEYEDLLDRVREDLGIDEIKAQVEDLISNVEKIVDVVEINTDNANDLAEKSDKIEKSIARLNQKLTSTRVRKSVKNAKINNKFEEEKRTYKDLSKSERANILTNEFLAGNKNVSALDVTKAEQGARLSDKCIEVIERHL